MCLAFTGTVDSIDPLAVSPDGLVEEPDTPRAGNRIPCGAVSKPPPRGLETPSRRVQNLSFRVSKPLHAGLETPIEGFENLLSPVSKPRSRGFRNPRMPVSKPPGPGFCVLAPDNRDCALTPFKFFGRSVDEPGDGVRGPQRVAVKLLQPPSTREPTMARRTVVTKGRARAATDGPSQLGLLPHVPNDREETLAAAKKVTHRIADSQRTESREALGEIVARHAQNPNELGDLGPDPDECATLRTALVELDGCITRYEALLKYCEAKRAVLEERTIALVDRAYDQVDARTERGMLPPESYASVRRFAEAHGESVAQGRARAQQMRAKLAAKSPPPANDTDATDKTGTNDA